MGMKYFPSSRHRTMATFREKCSSSFNRIRMQTWVLLTRALSPVNIISLYELKFHGQHWRPAVSCLGLLNDQFFAGIREGRANYNRSTSFSYNLKLQIFAKTLQTWTGDRTVGVVCQVYFANEHESCEKNFRRRSLILTRICSVTNLNWTITTSKLILKFFNWK